MKVLDLCCRAGGASMGYYMAGLEVTGVDINPQPNYPFRFYRDDGLEFLSKHGNDFDLISVSPPCQGYSHATKANSKWVNYSKGKDTPKLIEPFRKLLLEIGKPYIIENVVGAKEHLKNPIELCGSMFGLHIPRHRYFEVSFLVENPFHPKCSGIAKRGAETLGFDYRDMTVTGKGRRAGTSERWKVLMGITWKMSQADLAEAIPPVYTEYIGKQFIKNCVLVEQL